MGTQAAQCTDRLREMARSGDDWIRVEAAHALWRVRGDPAEPVAVLTELAQPLAEGHCVPVRAAAVRYLAAIGSPTDPTTAITQAILDNPRRIAYSGSWRIFRRWRPASACGAGAPASRRRPTRAEHDRDAASKSSLLKIAELDLVLHWAAYGRLPTA